MQTVHGTAVAIDGAGVLLRGPPGCGKSDLALRLIDAGAILVADDRSILEEEDGSVVVRAPQAIRDKLEVRGVGIVRVAAAARARLALVVDLGAPVERLPKANSLCVLGIPVRLLHLSAFEASAAAKIRLAVRVGPDDIES